MPSSYHNPFPVYLCNTVQTFWSNFLTIGADNFGIHICQSLGIVPRMSEACRCDSREHKINDIRGAVLCAQHALRVPPIWRMDFLLNRGHHGYCGCLSASQLSFFSHIPASQDDSDWEYKSACRLEKGMVNEQRKPACVLLHENRHRPHGPAGSEEIVLAYKFLIIQW